MKKTEKNIVLGITGGIAVYKSAALCSKLVQAGYSVYAVMTQNALKLISERIFFTLSGHPVFTDLFEMPDWKPGHIALADKADLLVIAPCTANFIGKYSNGIADDALTTVAMACTCPVLLAPAMNTNMWHNPMVQMNCKKLKSAGINFVGPASGHLACGSSGEGRMSEPEDIMDSIRKLLPLD